jgi:hypothetical protein
MANKRIPKKPTMRQRFETLLWSLYEIERDLLAALKGDGGRPHIDPRSRGELEAVAAKLRTAIAAAESVG